MGAEIRNEVTLEADGTILSDSACTAATFFCPTPRLQLVSSLVDSTKKAATMTIKHPASRLPLGITSIPIRAHLACRK